MGIALEFVSIREIRVTLDHQNFSHFPGCGFASGIRRECVTTALTPKTSGPDLSRSAQRAITGGQT